jgi:hypothetical protein
MWSSWPSAEVCTASRSRIVSLMGCVVNGSSERRCGFASAPLGQSLFIAMVAVATVPARIIPRLLAVLVEMVQSRGWTA